MRDTLENLYFGNITPNEQDITPGSVLANAIDRAEQCEEKLTTLLEGEEKTLLLQLLNAENEINSTIWLCLLALVITPMAFAMVLTKK